MRAALEAIVGGVDHLTRVDRGYTHNERVVATLHDGRSVFAKRAVDETTAMWLRREHQMYDALGDVVFAPQVIAWMDGELPVLVLEDLSAAVWPPPWIPGQVDAVVSSLAEVARAPQPDGLERLVDGEQPGDGWRGVLDDPAGFLSLGLCNAGWLERAGPSLCSAAAAAPLAGDGLLHGDVRSDNLCFRGGAAVLVDWNLASVGNPQVDVASWLPSLAAENGPPPEAVMPGAPPELAAWVAGFFAWRAGQPRIAHAPRVRQVQRQQLVTALPWAARALGLAPPGAHRGRGTP